MKMSKNIRGLDLFRDAEGRIAAPLFLWFLGVPGGVVVLLWFFFFRDK
jgi:lipid-A-disaccharide synthase-like uncharacterized protein